MMKQPIKVVGFDPSLRNWGMSKCLYYPETRDLKVIDLGLINPSLPTGKVKQGELDIIASMQLFQQAQDFIKDVDIVCAEIPVGSQSSRAMVSYATCTSIIGALLAQGMKLVAVTPTEVKKIVGTDNPTKHQIIEWVLQHHQHVPFPMYTRKGKQLIVESKAEHMADSIVAIHAALQKPRFNQLILSN